MRIGNRGLIVGVVLVVGLAGACSTGGGGGGGARGELINLSACPAGLDTDALAAEAVPLVNQQRTSAGVAALAVDPVLTQVAQDFAEQMIAEGFATHENPVTGERVGDRLNSAGYVWTSAGENLNFGQCTASQSVNEWVDSSAHRDILMNPIYTETGMGLAQGGPERMYWVQVFATPAN
ncbi:MAG: CAP domain-containing protein [Phycisphaerae bacterium]